MKKNIKLVFIVCLVLGILLAALNLFAASQRGHLAELEEQQAARKKALGQIAAADVLGINPDDVVVPDEVELTAMDKFVIGVNNASSMLWVFAVDLIIIGIGGFVLDAWRKSRREKGVRKVGSSNNVLGIVIALLALCLDLAIATPVFLTPSNFLNVFQQISINFVVAVGMTFVIISGGIDLSVGSNIALSGLLMGILMKNYNVPVFVTILVCILFSGFVGLVNGVLISFLNLPPFIATLGTMSIVRGGAYTVTAGQPIYTFPAGFTAVSGRVAGIPLWSTLIMLVVIVLGWYILRYTRIGRFTYAVGGNENCARLSGINLKKVKCFVYVVSGLCCGVAALLLSSRLDSAVPTNADGQEMDAIAAVVIGGTSMSGGEGSMIGTLLF